MIYYNSDISRRIRFITDGVEHANGLMVYRVYHWDVDGRWGIHYSVRFDNGAYPVVKSNGWLYGSPNDSVYIDETNGNIQVHISAFGQENVLRDAEEYIKLIKENDPWFAKTVCNYLIHEDNEVIT